MTNTQTPYARKTRQAFCTAVFASVLACAFGMNAAHADEQWGREHHGQEMREVHEREVHEKEMREAREREIREAHERAWLEHQRQAEEWHRLHVVPVPQVVYAPPVILEAPPPQPSGINLIIPLDIR